ncbi:MAG: TIGR02680 family protein [Streptomycetales bacterium]
MSAELPTAIRNRWQPLRSGLVDLFYYDYQEFWFRAGCVMFRGNNGTGKSKVLALTLPFLLDGDLTPSRVEPDGDRSKRMEWNLLLGGKYEERIGYAWLEFGRVTEDGERAYLTIGCGLKAVAGRGIADRWFFLTSQRVGQDLFLIGKSGATLTRDRLTEAIGLHGQVTQKAEQYRRIIDEHLFHLGAERYDALINLLIQLRQPQLSKRPDEARLSRALSEALAPVDQAVLSDIATAFRDLEQQRDELANLRETRGHVQRFMDRYRRYAAVAARRQGRGLRRSHAAYEQVQRDLSAVRDTIDEASAGERSAQGDLTAARAELAAHTAVRDELTGDPRLKNLADAQRHAEQAATTAVKRRQAANRAEAKRVNRAERRGDAVAAADRTRDGLGRAARAAAGSAGSAGVADDHVGLTAPLCLPEGPFTDDSIAAADRAARQLADRRHQAVVHLTRLAGTAERRHADLVRARKTLSEREADRDATADQVEKAREALDRAIDAHVAAWRSYGRGLTELSLPDPDDLALAGWAESLDGAHPGQTALRSAAQASHQKLAHAQAQAGARLTAEQAALASLVEERGRLEAGEVTRPRPPYTRRDGAREGRPGAALWQVADFDETLGDEERAGLEAALEASGLLDAWLTPDGQLLEPDTHDVVALPGEPVEPNLTQTLRPAIDVDDPQAAALSPETVAGVLAAVGLGERDCPAWAGVDGRWRLGPLCGAWAKPTAEFVGHGAREEARRRRLAELTALIGAAEQAVAEAEAAVRTLAQRQAVLAGELDRQPTDQDLRDAHSAVTGELGLLEQARRKVDEAHNEVGWAERDLAEAVQARDEAAADLALPTALPELGDVREAVTAYRGAAVDLVAAIRSHAGRLGELATWTAELGVAQAELAEAEGEAKEAETAAAEERARLDTLQAAIGASVEELKGRLTAAQARIAELDSEIERLDAALRRAVERRAKAEGREEQLRTDLDQTTERRDTAVQDFQRFAATGLLAVACDVEVPDAAAPWAADPAVRLARRAEALLGGVDDGDEAWRRVQDEITRRYTELSEALTRHGHHAVAGLDDWFVVAIQFQGRERAPSELTGLLVGEIDYRESLLTAKERDLLEEHLVNDVASHLQELISEAEAQVAHMNAELEERPTSTGMRLRLRWGPRPDGPSGLAEARARLLRQGADLWSPADRAAVGDFLQRQIEAVRTADEQGTWQEHLRTALDYRAWHHFTIERYQDGRWRSSAGPASGGERVLTASLPLFAAASAHYRSAHPQAPRMVTLDEAFAGVDDDSRAKCLGLLATFDLDVVMTSEREWSFYSTVPGIATHQLVRRDGIDAVHVTRWEWDGSAARLADRTFVAREHDDATATTDAVLW